ncbi:lytic transglycosylase domain-containing protein [Actinophytocola sp.]|uniref:lytic transglycosylase domain-containing protein n=1 Tax=Actinophytocola sp. TaxID=1872138 RepID=UPI00389AC6FC
MTDGQHPDLRGVLLRAGLVLLVLALAGSGVWLLRAASQPEQSPVEIPAASVPTADVIPGAVVPPQPQAGAVGEDPLRTWANRVAGRIDIPARALMAYGNAELALRESEPACHLSWATLAGIGRVESNHGRFGGAVLRDDGRPSKPIIGVPLDGSTGVRAITDTDHGQFDGDPAVDRAVGPMQFIPSTWRKWTSDANLDGIGDPQQIDDAALAAGRYLCAGGRDLATPKGWWAAVFSYNNSVPYGQKVFGLADDYAHAAA